MATQKHWYNRKYILMHDNHASAADWSQHTVLDHVTFPLSGPDLTLLTEDAILIIVKPEKGQLDDIINKCPSNPIFVVGETKSESPLRVWANLPESFLEGDDYLQKIFLPYWQDAALLPSDDVGAFKSAKF